eukprot:jgi/Mesvir1/25341/Mv25453-RA.1
MWIGVMTSVQAVVGECRAFLRSTSCRKINCLSSNELLMRIGVMTSVQAVVGECRAFLRSTSIMQEDRLPLE